MAQGGNIGGWSLYVKDGKLEYFVPRAGSTQEPPDSLGFVIAAAHPADLLVIDRR